MLKIAGWLISVDAAEQWMKQHPKAFAQTNKTWLSVPAIPLNRFVSVRRSEDADFPLQKGQLTTVDFPKTSPEQFGTDVCILVRRLSRRQAETWNKFEPILPSEKDLEIAEFLAKDGLELGEWVTIPDPWQDEWPFSRRYPGRRPAPDPADRDTDSEEENL